MSGISNSDPRARLMSTPRPRSAPAHSATIAPTTASVTPTRIPPRIDGSAAGISSVVRIWRRVARSDRPSSSSPASTDRIPTIVATATGKNTISEQMTTLPARPGPNHKAMSGARARIGVAWAATRYGEASRSTSALRASAYPATSPRPAPTANPSATSTRVVNRCGWIVPAVQAVSEPTHDGGGRGQDERREATHDDDGLPEQQEDDERGPDREECRPAHAGRLALAEVSPHLRAPSRDTTAASRSSIERGRGSSTGMSATTRPGLRRHHDDPVGDEDRLGDAVRDQHDRRSPARSQSRSSSRSNRSRLSASSALNGSSRSSTSGSSARARASATRWRVPPESSAGRLPGTPGSSDDEVLELGEALRAAGRRPAGELERVRDVVGGRAPRQQARLLEHEADPRVGLHDRGRRRASPCPARAPGARRSRAAAWTCRSRSAR